MKDVSKEISCQINLKKKFLSVQNCVKLGIVWKSVSSKLISTKNTAPFSRISVYSQRSEFHPRNVPGSTEWPTVWNPVFLVLRLLQLGPLLKSQPVQEKKKHFSKRVPWSYYHGYILSWWMSRLRSSFLETPDNLLGLKTISCSSATTQIFIDFEWSWNFHGGRWTIFHQSIKTVWKSKLLTLLRNRPSPGRVKYVLAILYRQFMDFNIIIVQGTDFVGKTLVRCFLAARIIAYFQIAHKHCFTKREVLAKIVIVSWRFLFFQADNHKVSLLEYSSCLV